MYKLIITDATYHAIHVERLHKVPDILADLVEKTGFPVIWQVEKDGKVIDKGVQECE